jgi:outer membrane receptor protein involved in Fe transport
VRNRDRITPGGGSGSLDGDHRFSRFNPAIGLTWNAAPGLNLYAGYNQGSRTPTAVELGCADPENPCKLPNAMAGDPPLRQVVTKTWEAGVRGKLADKTRWNAGVFRADNDDDILFVADNSAGFGYFRNVGKTRRQGVELGIDSRFGDVTLSANYTYLDATFRSPETLNGEANSSADDDGNIEIRSGDRIPLIPRHIFKARADWRSRRPGRWKAGCRRCLDRSRAATRTASTSPMALSSWAAAARPAMPCSTSAAPTKRVRICASSSRSTTCSTGATQRLRNWAPPA